MSPADIDRVNEAYGRAIRRMQAVSSSVEPHGDGRFAAEGSFPSAAFAGTDMPAQATLYALGHIAEMNAEANDVETKRGLALWGLFLGWELAQDGGA